MSEDHDVVVTGIGITSPIGGTAPDTWQAMLDGRIGVTANTAPWVEKYKLPVGIHAPLLVEPTEIIPRVEARRLDRSQQVAMVAAREAWADAGSPEIDPERMGVVVGTGIGGALTLLGQDDILEQTGIGKVAVMTIPMLMPNGPAAAVGLWAKARGGVHAPVAAWWQPGPREWPGPTPSSRPVRSTSRSPVAPRPASTNCRWPAFRRCVR